MEGKAMQQQQPLQQLGAKPAPRRLPPRALKAGRPSHRLEAGQADPRAQGLARPPAPSRQPLHNHRRHGLQPDGQLARAVSCSERPTSTLDMGTFGRSLPPQSAPQRLRVAVDVDEVLGRFVYSLNKFCEEQYGMQYDVQDYWIYEFAKIWGCSQDKSNDIVHAFFESDHFNDGIPVIPGAYDALLRLQSSCDLVVVTSRQHVIQDLTNEWLERHFPALFSDVYFGNHFALQGTSRKKSDICREIGAHVLIDDNPGYAMDCALAGIHVLLYDWEDSYPWSKLPAGSGHANIRIVHDWAAVEEQLALLADTQQQQQQWLL